MRQPYALIVSLVVAAALVPAASAAPRSSGYAAGVKQAGGQVSASLESLVKVVSISLRYPTAPTEARQCAAILAGTVTKLQATDQQLTALHPPKTVAAAHVQLMAGTALLAQELKPLIVKLRAGYLIVAAKVLSLPAVKTIETAAAKLKAAGYPTGI